MRIDLLNNDNTQEESPETETEKSHESESHLKSNEKAPNLGFHKKNFSNRSSKFDFVSAHFESLVKRIARQLDKIDRNARVNLIIGAFTSVIAIILLFSSLYQNSTSTLTKVTDLLFLLPRISTALFIEIFSFFFLRLYRRNIDEKKYYINELTNIDMKCIALKSAFEQQSSKDISLCIQSFSSTDRNTPLRPGESTSENQKMKLDNESDFELFSKIADFLKFQQDKKSEK